VIVRVALLPHPPILVPELAGGAACEGTELRQACIRAAHALAQCSQQWVAIAAADPTAVPGTAGSFIGYGVDVRVTLQPGAGSCYHPELPLPMLIAGWLREQVGAGDITVTIFPVAPGASTEQCRRRGGQLAERLRRDGTRAALLVLGDGAATHSLRAPGSLDPRARELDASVAAAFAAADPGALLELDPQLADELLVAGREAWQVAAAAALRLAPQWRGELLYSAAPYGVAYHVAVWEAELQSKPG
jgi:aromatic ring-opening dioxygenase LigB subunit